MPNQALCVGINDYPGEASDLSGCVNDANDWSNLFRANGYHVTTLLDEQATRENILATLRGMVLGAKWGTRVVFAFSGHGSWEPDRDGDEADGRDEVLCCHDYDNGGRISDDDLQAIFASARSGVSMLVLSDSCHSGTMTRAMGVHPSSSAPVLGTPKFIPPTMFSDIDFKEAVWRERTVAGTPRKAASLISGCDDAEYSYDASFQGRPNGAFSRAALDMYEPGISLNNWYKKIRQLLPSGSYPQTPQLFASSLYRKYTRAV